MPFPSELRSAKSAAEVELVVCSAKPTLPFVPPPFPTMASDELNKEDPTERGFVVPIPSALLTLSQTKFDEPPNAPELLNWIWLLLPPGTVLAIVVQVIGFAFPPPDAKTCPAAPDVAGQFQL